jgi:hypothetical protein
MLGGLGGCYKSPYLNPAVGGDLSARLVLWSSENETAA